MNKHHAEEKEHAAVEQKASDTNGIPVQEDSDADYMHAGENKKQEDHQGSDEQQKAVKQVGAGMCNDKNTQVNEAPLEGDGHDRLQKMSKRDRHREVEELQDAMENLSPLPLFQLPGHRANA